MCSTINMDQQQQYVQSTSGTEGQRGDGMVGSASELPPDISQMDFQTIKAASDTLKVSEFCSNIFINQLVSRLSLIHCSFFLQKTIYSEFQITIFSIGSVENFELFRR